jgi:uncharacterized protein (UPF0261 family)
MSGGTVLLLGTFDTKGDEYAFVRARIIERGHRVLTMDLGVLAGASASPFPVDIAAADVAKAGGGSLDAMRERADRGSAVDVMLAGARSLVRDLHAARRFDAVLGLGGGGGTTMITAAMRELPVGVPKLMVSTMASGSTSPYVDVKDITMMYSVVDIAGLNPISTRIFANAAGAICGMVESAVGGSAVGVPGEEKPLIAATMFGVTTPCVTAARKRLEAEGYEVLVFHATGSGGRAMEALIADGYFAGVLDVTTTEWCDEVVGGVLTAGPDRLSAAGRLGIPQVVSVGALDMVNFGGVETVPRQFHDRNLYKHNATVTLMRTTPDECREIGRRIGEKLAAATGPVVVLLPLRGVSMLDADDKPFRDAEADAALFESLRSHVGPNVRVREIDAHINDPAFADALADEMLSSIDAYSSRSSHPTTS